MKTIEKNNIRGKMKTIIIVLSVLLAAAVGIVTYRHFLAARNKIGETTSGSNNGSTTDKTFGNSSNDNFDYKGETATSAPAEQVDTSDPYSLYNAGVLSMSQQNFQEAINYFDLALALKNDEPDFYSKKTEAQVALGDKDAAIATLKLGLSIMPDNENLENKLRILEYVEN